MIWGEETPGSTERFAPRELPAARSADAESTAVLGVAATEPTVEPTAPGQGGAGLAEVEASAGKSSWQRRLAPRHREAVQTFFTRSDGER
jgi:hypothetical protein